MNALPKPPSDNEVLFQSVIAGLLIGEPISGAIAGAKIGSDADQKWKAIAVEQKALRAAVTKLDAAHMMLPIIAKKYAVLPTQSSSRIIANVDEAWLPTSFDWISLYNNGPALQDCTIAIQLSGLNGESRKNVHFVRDWPSNTYVYARYKPGNNTVIGIQNAEISIWSPKFTTATTYVYQGPEKDKDFARICSNIEITGSYLPYTSGILWDTQRGVKFTLGGVKVIPKCRLDVTFRNQKESGTWFRDLEYWMNGQTELFQPTTEPVMFDPTEIELVITFSESAYRHRVILPVKN